MQLTLFKLAALVCLLGLTACDNANMPEDTAGVDHTVENMRTKI